MDTGHFIKRSSALQTTNFWFWQHYRPKIHNYPKSKHTFKEFTKFIFIFIIFFFSLAIIISTHSFADGLIYTKQTTIYRLEILLKGIFFRYHMVDALVNKTSKKTLNILQGLKLLLQTLKHVGALQNFFKKTD